MAHKIFSVQQKIRFQHTDPAGIVFFPRYAEMINASNEDLWEIFGIPFDTLHGNAGVPAVNLNIDFKSPAFLGDVITKNVEFTKIGGSSYTLRHWFECNGRLILEASQTCVYAKKQDDGEFRPAPIPDTIRSEMQLYLRA